MQDRTIRCSFLQGRQPWRNENGDHRTAVEEFWLTGGSGNDRLIGNRGNDWLNGAAGRDILFGGAGAGQFLFSPSDAGVDLIADAEAGGMLRLAGVSVNSLSAGDGSAVGKGQAQIRSAGGVT